MVVIKSHRPIAGKSGFLFPDFQSLQRIWTHPLVLKYNSERYEIMQQKKVSVSLLDRCLKCVNMNLISEQEESISSIIKSR